MADVGAPTVPYPLPSFEQGRNPVDTYIPVAQISYLLENPGGTLDYDGRTLRLPDIRLVYWAGGNPFHHHQDLNRLRRAFARPDTIVVHESFWTATARHADIVLPTTASLERDDVGCGRNDGYIIAMPRALEPMGEARDDYEAFAELSKRLGAWDEFTEGRTAREWVEHIYERFRSRVAERDVVVPAVRRVLGERRDAPAVQLRRPQLVRPLPGRPRRPQDAHAERSHRAVLHDDRRLRLRRLPRPSGVVGAEEWLGSERAARFPLHLIANQPTPRLHGQLDAGGHSQASKVAGREPIRIHPDDATARGISDGDVVRVFTDRGSCLAGAIVTDEVRPRVVNLSTGAWFDPVDPSVADSLCAHGNPNVLTTDRGTSRLAQGSTGQHVLVEIERFDGELPPVRARTNPEVRYAPDSAQAAGVVNRVTALRPVRFDSYMALSACAMNVSALSDSEVQATPTLARNMTRRARHRRLPSGPLRFDRQSSPPAQRPQPRGRSRETRRRPVARCGRSPARRSASAPRRPRAAGRRRHGRTRRSPT